MRKMISLIASLILILLILPLDTVEAGQIDKIDMYIVLHEDGSATIRDERHFTVDEGTDYYIGLNALFDYRDLIDYRLYDSQNIELERVEYWDDSWTREEKAGKYSLVETDDLYDVVFGFGDYGNHKYTLEYRLNNIILNLEDGSQYMHRLLIAEFEPVVELVVYVVTDFGLKFEYPSTSVWGIGSEGSIDINENYIYFTNKTDQGEKYILGEHDYLTSIILFDSQYFNAPLTVEGDRESFIETAVGWIEEPLDDETQEEEVVENQSYEKQLEEDDVDLSFLDIVSILAIPVLFFYFLVKIVSSILSTKADDKKADHYWPSKVEYYKELPSDNFLQIYNLYRTGLEGLLFAFIIKWIFEGRLIEDKQEAGIIFKRDRIQFYIRDSGPIKNELENQLWGLFENAANKDNIVTKRRLSRTFKSEWDTWKNNIEKYSEDYLLRNSYYNLEHKKRLWKNYRKIDLTDKGRKKVEEIHGFKEYLENYSSLQNKSSAKTHLWQDYLIWAGYFRIPDKLYKEFEKIDPSISDNPSFRLSRIIELTKTFCEDVNIAYSSD